MTRTMLTVIGAALGFIEGFVFFVIINSSTDAPLRLFSSGAWMDYPPLIFAGVGAISGAVLGWAVYVRTNTPRMYVSVPRRRSKAGAPPNHGLFE